MSFKNIRVRFAPAPTGMMHLGNVRAALMNFLFAQQKQGTFVLRIEDTDAARNYDPSAKEIIDDLSWLGLFHTEGPVVGGPYAPYFQSQRDYLYQENLNILIEKNAVYRCFCTQELLEKTRKRQIALKQPPRYDRTCLNLSSDEIQNNIIKKVDFIWRFKLDHNKTVTVDDLAHGITKFELKHFSDFPLTRNDGSFTFIFANFVDDMLMKITHIFRGEDHLTNSACQASLFEIFDLALPKYWHMPILCNIEGKKLSKRDFGFSLRDLQTAGYLPEAINNYLAIIGGSFKKEIMTPQELVDALNFETMNTTGQIKYDVEKLQWVNRKWISLYEPKKLTELCLPFLKAAYSEIETIDFALLTQLIQGIKTEMSTLADCTNALSFYFRYSMPTQTQINSFIPQEICTKISTIIAKQCAVFKDVESFLAVIKKDAQGETISLKDLYSFMRMALTGLPTGPGIGELFAMLGTEESKKRLISVVPLFN